MSTHERENLGTPFKPRSKVITYSQVPGWQEYPVQVLPKAAMRLLFLADILARFPSGTCGMPLDLGIKLTLTTSEAITITNCY